MSTKVKRRTTEAFTLVETLVVLGIILILASISYVVYAHVRASAKDGLCISNLEQLGKASHLYALDYDDTLPPDGSFDTTKGHVNPDPYKKLMAELDHYGPTKKTWVCPLSHSGWQRRYSDGPIPEGIYVVDTVSYAQYWESSRPVLSTIAPTAVYLADPVVPGSGDESEVEFSSPHGANVCNMLFFDGHVELSRLPP